MGDDSGMMLTMLIADDEAAIQNSLRQILNWKELGIELIDTASDGLEALQLIRMHKPDIVLTDIKMPFCDGIELIKQTRSLKLQTKFIILSGYDDFEYAKKAIQYEVSSYLLKPIVRAELLSEITRIQKQLLTFYQGKDMETFKQRQIQEGTTAMQENFMNRLLQSRHSEYKEIENQLNQLHIPLEMAPLNVILFSYRLPDSKDGEAFSQDDYYLFIFAIKNIIYELCPKPNTYVFSYSGNYIAVIYNMVYQGRPLFPSPDNFCKICINTIYEFCHIHIQAGIGQEVCSPEYAYVSSRAALNALAYGLYLPQQMIFDSSHYCPDIPFAPRAMDAKINTLRLADSILAEKADEIQDYLNQFFNNLFYIPEPPPSYIRGMCIYLIMDTQKNLRPYAPEHRELFQEDPYHIINHMSCLDEIREWIQALFLRYAQELSQYGTFKKDPVIEKINAYIAEHIHEKILLEQVASYVNLSETYLSTYFKEKTKETLKHYILKQKMEYAREMLKNPYISVSEVSFAIGYEDFRSFHRIFKKIVGVTPSEYQLRFRS